MIFAFHRFLFVMALALFSCGGEGTEKKDNAPDSIPAVSVTENTRKLNDSTPPASEGVAENTQNVLPAPGGEKPVLPAGSVPDKQKGVQKVLTPKKFLKKTINPGADFLVSEKLSLLSGKRVAVATNHTALLTNGKHLVDELMSTGVNLVKVFSPEHGFRGTADAGEKVASSKDPQTGLMLVSLYGNNKKPTAEQLKDIDVVVFDIQDVGTRHYTYISTLAYIMEACAENNKEVIVLDRPNPNGWYVDGPMMQAAYTSFIGMHKIPVVHGMTIGEYAKMVNEEGWLKGGKKCTLSVIPCSGYRHSMKWEQTGLQWIPPSPNLGTEYAAYLYPVLCWYEATPVSVGRGTEIAFTITGAPWFKEFPNLKGKTEAYQLRWENYDFTPVSIPGKAKTPPFMNEKCQGIRFTNRTDGKSLFLAGLMLLEGYYQAHTKAATGKSFFTSGLEKWAGNTTLQQQITKGESPEVIYESWQKETEAFRNMRKKYLMYAE